MGILFLRVKYFYAAVHMLSGYINALFIQEIEQHGLPYRSQIPGNDLVVIVRLPSEILQVLFDSGSRGRGHAGPHIHAVLQAVIHDFTGSQSGDFGPGFSVFGSGKHKSAASGHGPGGGKRALVAVAQRKAEFLLRDILPPQTASWDTYDLIVSNPPYIRESEKGTMEAKVLDHEPHQALFVPDEDPLLFYRAIAEFGLTHLHPQGLLFFEINEAFGQETIALLSRYGYRNIELRKDFYGKERMVKSEKPAQTGNRHN